MYLVSDGSQRDLRRWREAYRALKCGEHDEVMEIGAELLVKFPDDSKVLSLVAECLLAQGKFGLCYTFYKRLVELEPAQWELWNNLGRCYQELCRWDEAMLCMRRAMFLAPEQFAPYRNAVAITAQQGDFDAAIEWGLKAVERAQSGEDLDKIDRNLQVVHLSQRNWAEGWRCFDLDLGGKYRRDPSYNGEGRWDGTKGQKVIIFGEQGLGEELLFASMYPDALKDCRGILECDYRLEGLFKRSFPQAEAVHGTRHDRHLYWPSQDRADARCAAGALGGIYRRNGEFPRTPYLIADPVRRRGYRAMLDALPGRKIGLAWNGGRWNTRSGERSLSLGELRTLFSAISDAAWISLEYRKPDELAAFKAETGIEIHHWPWAVQSKSYDDTAALVAELDAVVSVTTAVAFLAGALGKETHVLLNEHPTWHWSAGGEMPWLDIKTYRKTGLSWAPVVQQIAEALGGNAL